MPRCFFVAILLLSAVPVIAQELFVDGNVQTLPIQAGEAQSTVVPPGKKSQCPGGRFLVSNDLRRPPQLGTVVGRDLENSVSRLIAPVVEANFDLVPNSQYYLFCTNDHDLLTLRNGDVLYLTGACSRVPLKPKPAWFDVTFRGDFGPGARSDLLVWRSTDCGENFKFISEVDPALMEDGSCALPQVGAKLDDRIFTNKQFYLMGGSDGQLVRANPYNDQLYLTFQCVGFYPKNDPKFILDRDRPLDKTLIAASYDKGESWKSLGFMNKAYWRIGVVPLKDEELAFKAGISNLIAVGKKNAEGKYDFDTATPMPGEWGWGDSFQHNKKINSLAQWHVRPNTWSSSIVARAPDSDSLVIVFPATIPGKGDDKGRRVLGHGYGYSVFFYDPTKEKYAPADPVVPTENNPNSFIAHLAAIDLGQGPVLLYWYDIDTNTRTATMRGRLITGEGLYSADFAISQDGGQPRSFDLTRHYDPPSRKPDPYWFGDYLTAGGYWEEVTFERFSLSLSNIIYHFYPMWVEPDKTIRYTHVKFVEDRVNRRDRNFTLVKIPPDLWQPQLSPIKLVDLHFSKRENEIIREYGIRSRKQETKNREAGTRCTRFAKRN